MQSKYFVVVVSLCFFLSSQLIVAADNLVSEKNEPTEKEGSVSENQGKDIEAQSDYLKAKDKLFEQKYAEALVYLEKALKNDPQSAHLNNEISKVYAQTGEMEKAVVASKKAVAAEPNKVEYRLGLAEVLTANKNYAGAREEYVKVVELEPTNQKAGLLIAMLDSELGDDNKAIEQLSKLARENPDNPLALFYRARIYIEKNRLEEAKADLEKCIQQRPSFVEAGTALGLLYEKNEDADEAIRVYSKIQGQGPFKKRLAFLFIQKNKLNEALEALTEYEESQPDDYSARVKLGLLHFELKNYDKAKEKFQKILKEQPSSDNVHFYLGWVYKAQKQWNLAVEEFKKVTPDSSLFSESMLYAGFVYKETNRVKEGLAFSKQLIRKYKNNPEFYDLRASLFESEKKYNEALQVLEEGLKQTKNDEKLLYFKGALFDKMGKSSDALSMMKKLVDVNPDHAHALNFIAYFYAERGENLSEAEEKATKALSLRPNDGYITDTLAWIKFKKGEVDAAIEKLEKAAEIIPEEAIVFEHLGDVYSVKNQRDKALTAYRKAASLAKGKDQEMVKKIESKVAMLEVPEINKKEVRVPSNETNRNLIDQSKR